MSFQEEAFKILMAEIHKLRAENAKLKEALATIAEFSKVRDDRCGHQMFAYEAIAKAEEILK